MSPTVDEILARTITLIERDGWAREAWPKSNRPRCVRAALAEATAICWNGSSGAWDAHASKTLELAIIRVSAAIYGVGNVGRIMVWEERKSTNQAKVLEMLYRAVDLGEVGPPQPRRRAL